MSKPVSRANSTAQLTAGAGDSSRSGQRRSVGRPGALFAVRALVVALLVGPIMVLTVPSTASALTTCAGNARIFGIVDYTSGGTTLSRLYVTEMSSPTTGGGRSYGAHPVADLGYRVKAMAAITNSLVYLTDMSGSLHKVAVYGSPSSPWEVVDLPAGSGWTHDLLTYDGHNHLFGTAAGMMLRYTLDSSLDVVPGSRTVIGPRGWYLKTLFGVGDGWVGATTSTGELVSYHLVGANSWYRYSLRASTWTFQNMTSPGGGLYYAQSSAGAFYFYRDEDPFDGRGGDISSFKTLDSSGWTQRLISAAPDDCIGSGSTSSGALSDAAAVSLFNTVVARSDITDLYSPDPYVANNAIEYRWPEGNDCFARAYLTLRIAASLNSSAVLGRVWAVGEGDEALKEWYDAGQFGSKPNPFDWPGLTGRTPYGVIGWPYHVAATVKVLHNGNIVSMVFDYTLFDHPVTVSQWLGAMTGVQGVYETTFGQANPITGEGTGYWPGPDPWDTTAESHTLMIQDHINACRAGRYSPTSC